MDNIGANGINISEIQQRKLKPVTIIRNFYKGADPYCHTIPIKKYNKGRPGMIADIRRAGGNHITWNLNQT